MDGDNKMMKIIAVIIGLFIVVGLVVWVVNSAEDGDSMNEENTSQSEQVEQQNLAEIVAATPELSTLGAAIDAAGLGSTFTDPSANLTVFAPTNAAFDALPDGTLDSLLLPENVDTLTGILTYHVVDGEAFSTDLSDGQTITTLNGATVEITINDNGVFVNDAQVVIADVDASNGVAHVIDAVLLPPQ